LENLLALKRKMVDDPLSLVIAQHMCLGSDFHKFNGSFVSLRFHAESPTKHGKLFKYSKKNVYTSPAIARDYSAKPVVSWSSKGKDIFRFA
jgi:microsomal dipeptidase-like Zn-dependent dipeptidase